MTAPRSTRTALRRLIAATTATALAATGLAVATTSEPAGAEPVHTTVDLVAIADTSVEFGDPTTPQGSDVTFDVYGGTQGTCLGSGMSPSPHYGLLKFDLSSLPDGAVIDDVRLTLTSIDGFAQDGDPNHHAIVLDSDAWDENTTWATRPDDGTNTFAGTGDLGDGSLRAGGNIITSPNAVGAKFAFRADCGEGGLNEQAFVFTDDDATTPKTIPQYRTDFVGAVSSRLTTTDTLSLQIFNTNACTPTAGCQQGEGAAYWVRYLSREAENVGSRPTLSVTYTVDVERPAGPVLLQAVPNGAQTLVTGRLQGPGNDVVSVEFFSTPTCTGGTPGTLTSLGTLDVTTDDRGEGSFAGAVGGTAEAYLVARATPTESSPTALSACIVIGPDNDTWTRALEIPLSGSGILTGQASGFIDLPGGNRWYKFRVQPGAKATVTLSNLPADYDLALFRDIGAAFTSLQNTADLLQLTAEFAPSAFSPSAFSPSAFSPSAFSPSAFSPSAFSPSAFSPSVFSPSAFSPSAFSPSAFSPSAFSPSAFSPSAFSPSAFSPSAFSPSAFSPSAFSPETFSSAQTRSLVAFSAATSTTPEIATANTWNSTGFYYVRVNGKNGAFSLDSPFRVDVTLTGTSCAGISPIAGGPTATAGNFRTVVLWNSTRFAPGVPGNSAAELTTLRTRLATFVARPEVRGVLIDVGQDPRVAALKAQADANPGCPFAQNLVAGAIKDHVLAYRALNPIEYVTIVGNDAAIPFYRYPDQGLLGPESDYVPPVLDTTTSEAALRLNYVLGQDEYGATRTLSLAEGEVPVPDLAVGRLVETAAEITGMLDAYLGTAAGVVATPTSSLVTGYDFLEDAANAVVEDLAAGTGRPVNQLVTPSGVSPQDSRSWTADQLRQQLLGARNDLVFLAGHFSANSALAADFTTSVLTTELTASAVDMTNAIVFSAGCHSGYTIVDTHVVPGVTEPLDWTQAFARKRATLIAGTGYQYGDTDFLEYSERIYAGFARQLRLGTGPVSVGQALVRSKQAYLESTADVRGLHRKSLLIATVYGLPMLSVDLPTGRIPVPTDAPVVTPTAVTGGPGAQLGLEEAETTIDTSGTTAVTVPLTDLNGGSPVVATYLRGSDGVTTNPAEPALPLESVDVSAPDLVLRGVGFRGGSFSDSTVVPLTGAATTELRGVHVPFSSPVFFPMRIATPNYFGALNGGDTRLLLNPAQHKAVTGGITSILRRFLDIDLKLFYSANISTFGPNTPALAAAPSITDVTAAADGDDLLVSAAVFGEPSAGIQEVWVTYTGHAQRWDPLDLVQCVPSPTLPAGCATEDSTRWIGRIVGGATVPTQFVVHAVNGVGLVSVDDNVGAYYSLTKLAEAPVTAPTELALQGVSTSGAYGSSVTVAASLTSNGSPLAGRSVVVGIGGASAAAVTGADGVASATVTLLTSPGLLTATASYAGETGFAGASASAPFTVTRAGTTLTLATGTPVTGTGGTATGITATLRDANGVPLLQRSVTFTVAGATSTRTVVAITDFTGRASLGTLDLAPGTYAVRASFTGSGEYSATQAGPVNLVVGGRERLQAVRAQLVALRATLPAAQAARVTLAIAAIDVALTARFWTGPNDVDLVRGALVMPSLSTAVATLWTVTPRSAAVVQAMAAITTTQRSLVVASIAEAAAGPNIAGSLTLARRALATADAQVAAGRFDQAAASYLLAWSLAEVAGFGR